MRSHHGNVGSCHRLQIVIDCVRNFDQIPLPRSFTIYQNSSTSVSYFPMDALEIGTYECRWCNPQMCEFTNNKLHGNGLKVFIVAPCFQILKWHWLTHWAREGRYRAAREAKMLKSKVWMLETLNVWMWEISVSCELGGSCIPVLLASSSPKTLPAIFGQIYPGHSGGRP